MKLEIDGEIDVLSTRVLSTCKDVYLFAAAGSTGQHGRKGAAACRSQGLMTQQRQVNVPRGVLCLSSSIQHTEHQRTSILQTTLHYRHPNTMKLTISLLLIALLAAFAAAAAPHKPVIVSYPNDTPQSVVEQAMEAIRKAVCHSSSQGRPDDADAF